MEELITSRPTGKQHNRQAPGSRTGTATRVLFVIDTLEVGGTEQSLLDTVTRLRNIQPVVCHIYSGDALKQRFIEAGIDVCSIGLQKKYGLFAACRKLKTIVNTEKPDLMVGYLTRSELVTRMVGRASHIPVIGTFVSDLYGKAYNQSLSRKARLGVSFFRFLNRITARLCKGFIANSEAIKRLNANQLRLPPGKIEVINRGRNSQQFAFRPRILFPGNPVRFLNIGRLVPVKGQRDLILAFHAFLQVYPYATLHIAGEGPERESLLALIKKQGLEHKVTLLGNCNDVPGLIQAYDCFMFPSYSEGFSGAVVEAMMSGLPVLASNIPANEEVLRHLITGYLFETASVTAITNAMIWYAGNRQLANELAVKAHEYAVQHFELERIAQNLETYLQKMIAENV
ncbi:glycosyltransferase [Paraflavitalea soli]|uniref:Glycosyltransferase n=1 Tax=Paraflavitalea soli TaxID=2315862 RepID=A0A3B7MQF1_9BACT|nr:glycosyltransferase family 4 protein [Paraflavitalea soli]AXY75549.1 glycosyltransferase [Paraflavitalea soli]